jgi:hypothetical protein
MSVSRVWVTDDREPSAESNQRWADSVRASRASSGLAINHFSSSGRVSGMYAKDDPVTWEVIGDREDVRRRVVSGRCGCLG